MMSYNLRCISPTDFGKKAWFYRADLVIDDIEEHPAYGNGANVRSRSQMSHNGSIDQPQQWNGDVRHDGGQGYLQYLSVVGVHKIKFTSLKA